mmetsp:Transcript_17727/g.30009  ORF Transcript_17727/g.30009 Transcript_17727/m.30009 type:complete len:111 (-) Transcript_17727:120-452(-)|eukprot:CAMPEP_0168614304 /NCGR_PEP_ID=MMETSP0449_2-20121227/3904_1 /TAXON_ID=1082188 /ORGANISM="Strombidium rassoulzadegani, Strain ras09" /LENGTH=110 /DNA_ID=CAMNT_0008654977 /DNA_START=20 /DNA_END=352 /DNA_ORIENTATION=-
MNKPLPRRFYQVLSNSAYLLIFWLLALILALSMESGAKYFEQTPQYSYSFFIATTPLYGIVLFGCYALLSIGYHLIVLEDCKEAQDELLGEIKEARKFLSSKGMKFEASN